VDNGIELPKISVRDNNLITKSDHIYHVLELANQFFVSKITTEILQYFTQRGISSEIIKQFEVGFAPGVGELEDFFTKKSISLHDLLEAGLVRKKEDGRIYEIFNRRIMFPIKNIYNKIVGFGGRALNDRKPKYINSPETIVFKKGEIMYGEHVATSYFHRDNFAIVVEGYMDVLALHQNGFQHAVASLGTSVSKTHLQRLWRSNSEIVLCLDGDEAGIRASDRLINISILSVTSSKLLSFIELPNGFDPDDLIQHRGVQSFQSLFDNRLSLSEMIWKREYNDKKFTTAESKAALEKRLEEYYDKINDSILRINFKRYFKQMLWSKLFYNSMSDNNREVIHHQIISSTEYSEIEYLEKSICTFLIKYPHIIRNIDNEELIVSIDFTHRLLNDFKKWIVEIIDKPGGIDNKVKNTRFYNTYLVLSHPDMLFLDIAFLNKSEMNQIKVLKWLCKKHYLLLLKKNLTSMLHKNINQPKSALYLAEIQQVVDELTRLSDCFLINS
jgi:DNA primase